MKYINLIFLFIAFATVCYSQNAITAEQISQMLPSHNTVDNGYRLTKSCDTTKRTSSGQVQNIQDLTCIDCISGVLTIEDRTEFYGDITMLAESMSWDLDNTSVHFWGVNSTIEFAGRNSNIQFTQPQSQIIFSMDSCKLRLDGSHSIVELSNTSFMHYKNNSTGSGTASLGSNSPASTLTAPYTWLKFKSSDGSTVYVPAWK
jgi:hypothetical protein